MSASVFAFLFLYYGCLEAGVCGGGTVGKRLCGLMVANDKGFPVPIYRSISRTAVKFGVPVLLFKVGSDVALSWVFIGTAMIVAALLAVPVSVIVGRGSVGFHDCAAATCVKRFRDVGAIRPTGAGWHVSLAIIIVAAVSLSVTAWLRSLIPLNNLSFRSVVEANTQTGEIEKEFLSGWGSETIRPFVRHITILPSAWEVPTDFTRSYTKVPDEVVSQFRRSHGAAVIGVELDGNAVDQRLLEQALIERVIQVCVPRLVAIQDTPTFIWLAFHTKSIYGPLTLDEVHTSVMMIRRDGSERQKLQVMLAEPSDHRFVFFGIQMSGFTVTKLPL